MCRLLSIKFNKADQSVSSTKIQARMREYYEKIIYRYLKVDATLSKEKSAKSILLILSLFFWGLILLLNITYPLYADDWGYTFMTGSELTQKITSFSDILNSQYQHYFLHGGRTIVHIIAESLLLAKGYWTDIINSIAYILFVYIIYKISNINKKTNPSLFFFINILIWFFQPAFAQTILWITGSANYLWGTLIIISFLYFVCRSFIKGDNRNSIYKCIFFFLCGIIAGWTNENTAVGMICLIFLLIIYKKNKQEEIPIWIITGLIGAIIGFIIMIAAPGNYLRYEDVIAGNKIIEQSKVKFYLSRLLPAIGDFYKFALPLVMIYSLVLVTYIYFDKKRNARIIYLSLCFCIAGVIADLAMIASPEFPPRAWFGIITFFIIAIGIIYANLQRDHIYISVIKTLLLFFASVYFLFSYQRGFKDLYAINKIFEKREQIIYQQPNKVEFDFVTKESINPQTGFPMIDEIPSSPNHWINMFYLRYHNIKSFKVESDK